MDVLDIEGNVFRLSDLPMEVIDHILGHVPLHRDLLNFALASRLCCALVVPQHTEYRVIHLADDVADARWTHLARRIDLASNIREIRVFYDSAPEKFYEPAIRYPKTLFDWDLDDNPKAEKGILKDMFKVLGCMKKLEKLHWNWVPNSSRRIMMKVLGIMKTIPTFEHLSFNYPTKFVRDFAQDKHPLWSITGLKSLSLEGSMWHSLSKAVKGKILFQGWIQSLSPSLQFLRLHVAAFHPYSDTLFLPHLRCLDLRGRIRRSKRITNFLTRHPTIEELALPLEELPTVPTYFLPNLKRLSCYPRALSDFEYRPYYHTEDCIWPLEYLHLIAAPYDDDDLEDDSFHLIDELCEMQCLNHNTLRVLKLEQPGSIQSLVKLAIAFPMIEELEISPKVFLPDSTAFMARSHQCSFPDLLLVFPHFPNLRVIHGNCIWSNLPSDDITKRSTEDIWKMYWTSALDPVTNFALNACTNPGRMLTGQIYDADGAWTRNAEVNHRILALARRCKKLEQIDSHRYRDEVIRVQRKKVDWVKVKVMAKWLGMEKDKVDSKWEEIEWSIEEQRSRDPFETMPRTHADM